MASETIFTSIFRKQISLIFWPQKGLFEFEAAVLTNLEGQDASFIVIFNYCEAGMATCKLQQQCSLLRAVETEAVDALLL